METVAVARPVDSSIIELKAFLPEKKNNNKNAECNEIHKREAAAQVGGRGLSFVCLPRGGTPRGGGTRSLASQQVPAASLLFSI